MSATNRGTERKQRDFYETPRYTIDSLLNAFPLNKGLILEPCAGNGAIVNAIKDFGYTNTILANDINESVYNIKSDGNTCQDFLTIEKGLPYSTIITNPPYSMAEEFIEHSHYLTEGLDCDIIMLLRLNFLGSQKRYNFWSRHPVNNLYVLSKRPSFTGEGTDATEYAWFIWDKTNFQAIEVI